jgi:hypothetical protein
MTRNPSPPLEDLQQINELAPKSVAAGLRYPENMMQTVGR